MTTPRTHLHVAQGAVAALLSIMPLAMVFLFIPFALYVGNLNEFTVSFQMITGLYLPLATVLAGIVGLVGILLPARAYARFTTLLAVTGILVWLQGNILVWDYGLLDGRSIDWSIGPWRGWLDLSLWISAVVVALFASRALGRRIMYFAIAIFCMQLTLFAYTWLAHQQQLDAKASNALAVAEPESLYRFSATKNIVHIIADGFQSDIFEEIINQSTEGTRYSSILDGFVFFPEHMGAFPYTHMSLPAIMSGLIYRNHVPIPEHLDTAMGEESILRVARDAGYDIDMMVPASLAYMYKRAPSTHLYSIPNQHHVSIREYETYDSARLLDLVLFRVVPHFLKRHIYNDQLWLVQSIMSDSGYMRLSFFSHIAFLRNLYENMTADRERPVYKLLHLMLSHNPMVTNNDCEYAGRVLPTVRATVMAQAGCGLAEVIKLLEKMKQLGIYDDATIILMADHGAWVPPSRLSGEIASDDKKIKIVNPSIVALAAPLLAIKEAGAKGTLRVSQVPSWIPDIAPTIASITGLPESFPGTSILDLVPGISRERRFFHYQYSRGEWTADYLSPIDEYIIKGSVFNSGSWHENATYAPGGKGNDG
ncbi:MAG: LTA synthase family protein [Gammaproteobacteria bacterium]|nr:LTA synthase family protein [Gammaproteobacteria bacterium]